MTRLVWERELSLDEVRDLIGQVRAWRARGEEQGKPAVVAMADAELRRLEPLLVELEGST